MEEKKPEWAISLPLKRRVVRVFLVKTRLHLRARKADIPKNILSLVQNRAEENCFEIMMSFLESVEVEVAFSIRTNLLREANEKGVLEAMMSLPQDLGGANNSEILTSLPTVEKPNA